MARFFISYSRADKIFLDLFIKFLQDTYSSEQIWYDKQIEGGSDWWATILHEIEVSDIVIGLFSNDALESEYCQKEIRHALHLNKPILPVVVRPKTDYLGKMVDDLKEILKSVQYVDLSSGFSDTNAITPLVRAINYLLEGVYRRNPNGQTQSAPKLTLEQSIKQFYTFRDEKQWHLARQALEILKTFPQKPLNIEELAASLDVWEKRYLNYSTLKIVIQHGLPEEKQKAIANFQSEFPDYDPEKLLPAASPTPPEATVVISWCDIPAGAVTIVDGSEYHHHPGSIGGVVSVGAFKIAKHVTTNGQFQEFIDANDGYRNQTWWDFSTYAKDWRIHNSKPNPTAFIGDTLPRTNVCWYEAIAYCRWLSAKLGENITLPTEAQWQLAAQGLHGRLYPWGDTFDKSKVHTSAEQVVAVTEYKEGASEYGVLQMSGNVFEWCLTKWKTGDNELSGLHARVIRGGSWYKSNPDHLTTTYRLMNYPDFRANNRGFRIALIQGDNV